MIFIVLHYISLRPSAPLYRPPVDARYALTQADVLGGWLRPSIVDYEVIRALPLHRGRTSSLPVPAARAARCRRPVMITELAVDAAGWRDLTGQLSRLAGVGSDRLLTLYEVGPDLDAQAAGVYLVSRPRPAAPPPIRPIPSTTPPGSGP